MKTSEVFKRAKNLLSTGDNMGKTDYVCYAIDRTRCTKVDKDKAKKIIAKLLQGHFTFATWLRHEKNINGFKDPVAMQITRHAWLDHLITHYSNIGD